VPALRTAIVIAIASGIWYGAITWLAYRVGADWEALQERIGDLSRTTGIIAAAVVTLGVGIWLVRRRRHSEGT
jgi:membrane protein DedA with SNARE-associated domain